jgi:succinoglycan biosynthesis protein ExoL
VTPQRNLDLDSAVTAKIAYFAHDLSDPAVHRRLGMLLAGGAAVTAIGFRRSSEPAATVEGIASIDLGRTNDGMLLRRGLSVVGTLARLGGLAEHVRGANVILARNLEMLTLAIRAGNLYAPGAAVVYECLDIHRMLLSKRLEGRLLRSLENRLWREVNLLLTSSPAFVHNYFIPRGFRSPIRLVENKVLMLDEKLREPDRKRLLSGPPWRIGWFGIIRCRRSLDMLCSLARGAAGKVEIVIRGRPTKAVFQGLDELIVRSPHVHFAGPYNSPTDLPAIYGDVHFSWAIDYYEAEQNSTWLLPNRIYEGSLYGTVPIGVAGVETGRWLAKRGAGVVLDEPLERQLIDFFHYLDNDTYSKLAGQVEALPRTDLVSDQADCRALVEALCAAQCNVPVVRSEMNLKH